MDHYRRELADKYSVRGRVFHKIREDILEGKYQIGEEIREVTIAKELGISRTPVREAIRQLALEGLLSVTPNRGAVVTGISPQDIEDIYSIRTLLEGLAARWAASKISAKQLKELEEIVELTEFYITQNETEDLHVLDNRFHEILYESSHSKPLQHILSPFHYYVQNARRTSLSIVGRSEKTLEEHKSILRALQAKDQDMAEIATNEHVKNAAENVLKNKHRDKND